MTDEPAIADIDWLRHMRIHALQEPSLFDGRLPEEWILAQCHMASDMVRSVCPEAVGRLERGTLSEDTYAGVVCQMVQGISRNDIVIAAVSQRLHQTLCKVALI